MNNELKDILHCLWEQTNECSSICFSQGQSHVQDSHNRESNDRKRCTFPWFFLRQPERYERDCLLHSKRPLRTLLFWKKKRHTFESMVTWGINLFVLCNFFDYFLNDNAIVHTNITWSQLNVIIAGHNCNFYGFVAWCLKKNRRSLQKILWIPCAPNESIAKAIKMTTGADSESNILFQHHFQRSLSNKHWFWFSFQLQRVHRREHEEYYHSQPSKWEQ